MIEIKNIIALLIPKKMKRQKYRIYISIDNKKIIIKYYKNKRNK